MSRRVETMTDRFRFVNELRRTMHFLGPVDRQVTQDNRAHPRLKVDMRARLLSLDGRCNYDCAVIDLSEGGARVSTLQYGLVPNRVFLMLGTDTDIFECDVRWRADRELGLRFVDSVARSTRSTLLRLCAERSAS